jgi:O-glycosyl hydrolase
MVSGGQPAVSTALTSAPSTSIPRPSTTPSASQSPSTSSTALDGLGGTSGSPTQGTDGGSSSASSGNGGQQNFGGAGASELGGASAGGGEENQPQPDEPQPDGPRPTVTAMAGTTLVKIDVGAKRQTFEGWGTSLCWWANHVGGWSQDAVDAVVDAVIDPVDGLGYNIFRYNIGGGENPAHDHMDQFRDMPGFQDEDGTWRWDADAGQRAVAASIVARGEGIIMEAFSNSPPYWMTKSGCASGSSDGSNNLKDDAYDAFAAYLVGVVAHYDSEFGIHFRTLEPLNEPNANWWKSNGSQEGCHFGAADQQKLIQAVGKELEAQSLTTVVSASDENSMDDALKNISGFSSDTLDVMQQINVHSYSGSKRAELRALATQKGKRLWQSESGPLNQDLSGDIDAALFMAGRIIDDLRDLQAEAWIDWQVGDPARSWASLTLDDRNQKAAPLKRFYMHAGFSRYIRPGAVFVDIDNKDMVAALSADGHSLAIVARNSDTAASRAFTFDLTRLPTLGSTVDAYRTSRDEDLEHVAMDVKDYQLVASLPEHSVTTFVISMP